MNTAEEGCNTELQNEWTTYKTLETIHNKVPQRLILETHLPKKEEAPLGTDLQPETFRNIPDLESPNIRQNTLRLDANSLDEIMLTNSPLSSPHNVNINLRNQENFSIPQPANTQRNVDLQTLRKPETNIYLWQALGMYLFLITGGVYLIMVLQYDLPLNGLYVVAFLYLIYCGSIYLFWVLAIVKSSWLDSYDIFKLYDVFSLGLALVLIYGRMVNFLSTCSFVCLPFLLTIFISLFSAKTATKDKVQQMMLRFFYTIQVTIIALKTDSDIDWEWRFILMPSWVCLTGIIWYSLAFFYSLYRKLLSIQNPSFSRDRLPSVIVWYISYYGIAIFVGFVLYGFEEALKEGGSTIFLIFLAYIGTLINILLFIYTIIMYKSLLTFITGFELIESHLVRVHLETLRKQAKPINFEIEQREQYFLMLSPSYFLPFNLKSLAKDQEILEQVKKRMETLKEKGIISNQVTRFNSKFTREDMKKSQQILTTKLDNKNLIMKRISSAHTKTSSAHFEFEEEQDLYAADNNKIALSINDLEKTEQLNKKNSWPKLEEEPLCYVCYKNVPNVIFISCGHGGVCYHCAVASIEKKPTCIQCRRQIEAIYRIEPSPILGNIVKGIENIKIIIREH